MTGFVFFFSVAAWQVCTLLSWSIYTLLYNGRKLESCPSLSFSLRQSRGNAFRRNDSSKVKVLCCEISLEYSFILSWFSTALIFLACHIYAEKTGINRRQDAFGCSRYGIKGASNSISTNEWPLDSKSSQLPSGGRVRYLTSASHGLAKLKMIDRWALLVIGYTAAQVLISCRLDHRFMRRLYNGKPTFYPRAAARQLDW